MAVESILEKVIETAGAVTEKVSDLKEDIWGDEQKLIIEEFKDSNVEKIKNLLSSINGSSELFDKSGFHLSFLKVSLGFPPVVTVEFTVKSKITKEERVKLLEETAENKIVRLLMNCLFKASDFYDKIQFGSYKLDIVEIELGLIPGVNLQFSR
ncbi:MAG TPA: hypothetical protein PKD83_08665 [Ignavibacteria bacterium]|nr:hypothetical protein [Ignavibacteria bacterium]